MKTIVERNPNFQKEMEDHKEAVIKIRTDATKAEREAIKDKEKLQKREELAKKQEWDEFNAL